MALKIPGNLWATLTQGSADAFIQASIATGLTGLPTIAYQLTELLIEFGVAGTAQGVAAASGNWEVAITRKSMTAMPVVTEKSMIHKFKRGAAFNTSGLVIADALLRITWPENTGPVIVEDPFYAQLDTASTSATNVVELKFSYQQIKISEVDRLQLIANSLTP